MELNTIVRNLDICGGSPTLRGRRITAFNAVVGIEVDGLDNWTKDFDISLKDAKDVLEYCSNIQCGNDRYLNYCEGCTLQNMEFEDVRDVIDYKDFLVIGQGDIYLGSKEDFEEEIKGRAGWKIAGKLLQKHY